MKLNETLPGAILSALINKHVIYALAIYQNRLKCIDNSHFLHRYYIRVYYYNPPKVDGSEAS